MVSSLPRIHGTVENIRVSISWAGWRVGWGIVGEDQSQLLAGMLRHACNHNTQEAEAGGPEVGGHLVYILSLARLDFTERPCFQQNKSPKKNHFFSLFLYPCWFVQIMMHLHCREVINTGKPLGSKVKYWSEWTCLRASTFFHEIFLSLFYAYGHFACIYVCSPCVCRAHRG